jgi:hypothetical protein
MTRRKTESSPDESPSKRWGIDKRVGPATLVNVVQLLTIVWWASSFHTQVNDNQIRTDERFAAIAQERKIQDEEVAKMQDIQESMLVQMTGIKDKQDSTSDAVKDIRDLLRKTK